jgi:hypothetical protein
VEGLKEADEIVAPNVDDFIRLYHQTVDDALNSRNGHWKTGKWVFLGALVAILVIAAFTCPDKAKHVEVLSDRMGYAISKSANEEGGLVAFLGMAAGNSIAKMFIQNTLIVNEYVLVSIGKIEDEEGSRVVSVGLFGHVFTASGEEMYERMKQALND